MDIVFATKNEGKLKEVRAILNDVNVYSLSDLNIDIDVIEDGETFEANAIKKAVEIMKISNKTVMSDDSGLSIDFFNGEPGIKSARYLGENTPYEKKNRIILERLKDVPGEKRGAKYICVIAAAFPNGDIITTRGEISGIIANEPSGSNGFGYDPIFYLPDYQKTMAEIPEYEKNKISHRAVALELMKKELGYKKVR